MLIRVYFYTPLNRHETRSRLLLLAIQHVTGLTIQPFPVQDVTVLGHLCVPMYNIPARKYC
jgi:hypothetical protein